jgi:hypothetical protein
MRPIDKILDMASRLDERMLNINGGRMWMAAHMRRGDCMYSDSSCIYADTKTNGHVLFSCQGALGNGAIHRGSP